MTDAVLTVLASGEGWVVVEKPWGMSVHNDPGHDLVSLVPRLMGPGRAKASTPFPVQPVHRLDRETSGVILLATDSSSVTYLSLLFQQGRVKKRYMALVHGRFDAAGTGDVLVWDHPLTKAAAGRSDPAGRGRRVHSETRFKVLKQTQRYALIDIELVTGRKHQIRRHAALAGHPVTGDTRYGSKRAVAWLEKNRGYRRLGLHSMSLSFTPGEGSAPVTVTSPSVPAAMIDLLDRD